MQSLLRTAVCLVLVWSAWSRCVWAQMSRPTAPSFRVEHIGVNDGLTQGSVYYMLKDSRNFLWFGTQDGLNRYDGHSFRTFRPVVGERGIPQAGTIRGVNILGIVEDPDGNLWVGTEEGLNRYDRQHDRFTCFFATDANHQPRYSRTLPFFADKTELLYLSDAEGLVRLDYRNRRKTVLAANIHPASEYDLPSSAVRTAVGDVWLHAPKGLMRYNLHDHSLTHYFSDRPDNRFGQPQTVFSFSVEADTILWIGTDAGLIRFDYRRRFTQTYDLPGDQPVGAIYSISPDERSRLWLGTQRNGVLYFDKRSRLFGQVTNFTDDTRRLTEFEIRKVYADGAGIIWANVDPDGLARIIPDAFRFGGIIKREQAESQLPDQQLSSYTVRGFMEERFDRLWIITGNGINVLNPRTNRIVQQYLTDQHLGNLPPRKLVRSIYRDPQRRIWIGTWGGVLAFQPKTETFDPVSFAPTGSQVTENYVRNMTSLDDSTLLAATEDGLYALNTRRQSWAKLPALTGQNIFNFWYDRTVRQLWVGTSLNGYYVFQLPSTPLAPWTLVRTGLKGSMVLHIRSDTARRTMWLATDRGLAAFRPSTGKLKIYTEKQGLANSFVYGSLADARNYVWMSTNKGLSRLDPATGAIKNFTLSDGLQGNEFNGNAFLRLATGELFFGGVSGFNRFRPDQYRGSSFSPTVHIYSLKVNEEPFLSDQYVGEAQAISLAHGQNTLSMEFAALDYFSNGHNAYQYQLTNYDPQWVMAGEKNYVRYANLPSGDYVFQVKAANRDGHWSSRIRTLAIHVDPPFWRTPSFVLLMALVLGLLTIGWIRQRENAIRRQETNRLRLAYDIQEQVKKDIARDLHDEIGTRLATLKLYTTSLVQHLYETPAELASASSGSRLLDASDAQVLKNNIFGLINSTISDVRNLLRKLNPQTLERYGYVAAVEELFSRINATGTITTHLTLANAPGEELPGLPADYIAANGEMPAPAVASRLPVDTEVMLYRITQELVSNSLKHATANHIDLYIQGQPNRLLLTYSDDGQGFDYEQIRRSGAGLGIGNIESRVAVLNGKITWQSQPGQGVRAQIDIPTSSVHKRGLLRLLRRWQWI